MEKDKSSHSHDITASEFDPIKALYSRDVLLPNPNAPILDNLTKFQETGEGIIVKPSPKPKIKDAPTKQDKTSASGSRFQPHQAPGPSRARRVATNVLTRMASVTGPLALLQRCMNQRIQVKVLTRNMSGIRGHCTGYLVAFDKHWNMALEDVTEVWTRKRRIKTPALGHSYPGTRCGSDDELEVPTPRVRVLSSTARTEECERFVTKLMMRGEHVAVVIARDT